MTIAGQAETATVPYPGGAATVVALDELAGLVGGALGYSSWHTITQARIDAFARATGDRQWIHVDRRRAATGPFGAPIAHGFLTLALFPVLLDEVLEVKGARLAVNYGLNRVRFPAPVRAGARVRLRVGLAAAEPVPGGVQVALKATFEVDGQHKPCCVAEVLFRYLAER